LPIGKMLRADKEVKRSVLGLLRTRFGRGKAREVGIELFAKVARGPETEDAVKS